jgi:lipopolysaccharide/colanic/teichoic acid biosynthesis glycosyltransferase
MYKHFFKRLLDIIISIVAIIIFSPLFLILAILVRTKLGKPVLFAQRRPGKNMVIKKYYKFRSMTGDTDHHGKLLEDEHRLTKFGLKLRNTSLDELPQLFDILLGKMSVVGPRPQTIENIMFMSEEQKKRQQIIPGLTGWAQVNGRNNTTWDERVKYDLEYMDKQSFLFDCKIILKTIAMVFKQKDVNQNSKDTDATTFETMGHYLLRTNQITEEEYLIKKAQIEREYNL